MMKKTMSTKMRVCFGLVVLAVIAVTTSCTAFRVDGLEVHQTATKGTSVGDFNIKVRVNKFLGLASGYNVFNITSGATDPAVIQAIRDEIQNRGGTSAVNVKIVYKATFPNLLLNGITFFIYAPATAEITGTIIKSE